MDRRKFIAVCSCCAFASVGAGFLDKSSKILPQTKKNGYVMRHIEVHIAEHCNLKCKYCAHFSCIADKEFYNLDKFEQDMYRMAKILNQKLIDLQILGGEPLLNSEINEYLKISRKCFPYTRIGITTNGTLLDDMNENFWITLNENDIKILPSIYDVKINWKSVLDKAQKYNVNIFADYREEEKLTLNNLEKFRKKVFRKTKLSTTENLDKEKIKCDLRMKCNSMYDGKIYPCATIAYIRHFNKKFNTDFKVTKKDYIDLYKVKNIKEIAEFINNPTIYPFCKYCTSDAGEVKWENSVNHSIEEWT